MKTQLWRSSFSTGELLRLLDAVVRGRWSQATFGNSRWLNQIAGVFGVRQVTFDRLVELERWRRIAGQM